MKLLFVIDSLGSGGAEKSLVNLLTLIDYSEHEVDLLMWRRGGINERYVPKQVHILPTLAPTPKNAWQRLRFAIDRLRSHWFLRHGRHKNVDDIAINYYHRYFKYLPEQSKEYDVAIAYFQRVATYYVAEKTTAKYKIGWVNSVLHQTGTVADFNHRFYGLMDNIVNVSEVSRADFIASYPEYNDKTTVIYDILNPALLKQLAEEEIPVSIKAKLPTTPYILTVARLNFLHKGMDIAMNAAKILHQRGIDFKWMVLGDGDKKTEIEEFVANNGLEGKFVLLGATPNPYPIIAGATWYAQPSRSEGFCISLAEARLFCKPSVVTEYDSVYVQMKPGVNGLVVPINAEALADGLERLIKDEALYRQIKANLEEENKGNLVEFEKFKHLIAKEVVHPRSTTRRSCVPARQQGGRASPLDNKQ